MTGEWYGLSYRRSICYGNATVGIIHDDGATFNGVRLTALQIALVLGAYKDNGRWGECPQNEEEEYLTSNSRGGRIPYLSECSRESVRNFYYRFRDNDDICWNDIPKPAIEHDIGFPSDFYKLFDCDQCHVSEHFRNNTATGQPINCSLSTINRNIPPLANEEADPLGLGSKETISTVVPEAHDNSFTLPDLHTYVTQHGCA
ncbi:hypothetical protein MTO96_037938 [Rhipicephalus appendiculatus]